MDRAIRASVEIELKIFLPIIIRASSLVINLHELSDEYKGSVRYCHLYGNLSFPRCTGLWYVVVAFGGSG